MSVGAVLSAVQDRHETVPSRRPLSAKREMLIAAAREMIAAYRQLKASLRYSRWLLRNPRESRCRGNQPSPRGCGSGRAGGQWRARAPFQAGAAASW